MIIIVDSKPTLKHEVAHEYIKVDTVLRLSKVLMIKSTLELLSFLPCVEELIYTPEVLETLMIFFNFVLQRRDLLPW